MKLKERGNKYDYTNFSCCCFSVTVLSLLTITVFSPLSLLLYVVNTMNDGLLMLLLIYCLYLPLCCYCPAAATCNN